MSLKDIKLGKYEIVADDSMIKHRIKMVATKIEEDYGLDSIVGIVPILNGGLFVGAGLAQSLNTRVIVEPIKISLYKDSRTLDREATKYFKFELEPNYNRLSECDVIVIVDDICDTGWTLHLTKEKITKNLKTEVPILTYTLINVESYGPMRMIIPDFWSFSGNPDDWYFGYGMDYKEGLFRNVNFIGKVDRFGG